VYIVAFLKLLTVLRISSVPPSGVLTLCSGHASSSPILSACQKFPQTFTCSAITSWMHVDGFVPSSTAVFASAYVCASFCLVTRWAHDDPFGSSSLTFAFHSPLRFLSSCACHKRVPSRTICSFPIKCLVLSSWEGTCWSALQHISISTLIIPLPALFLMKAPILLFD
jgi:hypothetical protein